MFISFAYTFTLGDYVWFRASADYGYFLLSKIQYTIGAELSLSFILFIVRVYLNQLFCSVLCIDMLALQIRFVNEIRNLSSLAKNP